MADLSYVPHQESSFDMTDNVFFSFDCERDSWRAAQIRDGWVKRERERRGFCDAEVWGSVGDDASATEIDRRLARTSVTIVLIGAETSRRSYVGLEISRSHEKRIRMFGIFIHKMKDESGRTDKQGANPFANWSCQHFGESTLLSHIYPLHDWVNDNGSENIAVWIKGPTRMVFR
jgi:hypothetical protein